MAKKSSKTPNTSAPEKAEENRAEVSVTGEGQPSPQASAAPVTEADNTKGGDKTSPNAGEIKAIALLVTARRDGFRRCNRAWSKEQTRVPIDELTADEVEALLAEPMLDVVVEGE